jgi:tripartite-type tricarboxylate transporter receptor subunit TctC
LKALQSPDIKKALTEGGAESVGTSPSEFATILSEDVSKYAKLVKLSGAKVD